MSKQTIYILIASLVVLMAWLGFEVFHQSQETTLPEIVQEQVTPLDPTLPTDFLEILEPRQNNRVAEQLDY